MSRKPPPQPKPKPRGRQGGRKPKFIRPGESVEMTKITFRIRTDIAEQIVDSAAAAGISKDEWLMRTVSPQWMAALDAYKAVPYPIAQQLDKALRALLTNTLESGRLNWTDVEPVEEAHAVLSKMAEWRSKNITHP